MIGPGWMPSRPRPLPGVRRGLWSYTPGYRRPQRARRRGPAGTATVREPVDLPDGEGGAPHDLPIARLVADRSRARHRALGEDLRRWLAQRWAWLRPRSLPIAVALAGLCGVLATAKYLPELSRGAHDPSPHCAFVRGHHGTANDQISPERSVARRTGPW